MPKNPSSATVSSKLICMIKKGISLFIIRLLVYELLCYRFTIGSCCFNSEGMAGRAFRNSRLRYIARVPEIAILPKMSRSIELLDGHTAMQTGRLKEDMAK